MAERLFTTPDRIIEAAAAFTAGGFEQSFGDLLEMQPSLWPARAERPMRKMRAACRPIEAQPAYS